MECQDIKNNWSVKSDQLPGQKWLARAGLLGRILELVDLH